MMRKLRILMISPQFKPVIGGYERAAERLSAELARQGHQVTVIAERRNHAWPSAEQADGYEIRRLWCVYRPGWHMLTSLFSYSRFLLSHGHRYQVFHLHQYGNHAALTIAIGHLLSKIVVLRTTSTRAEGIERVLAGNSRVARLVAALHRQVHACIATTSWAAEEVVRFGIPRERVVLIRNGVETSEFRPCTQRDKELAREHLGLSGNLVVLYCGRLAKEKNPTGLIEAWKQVLQKVPEALLVLVGDGPLRAVVESQIAQYGIADRVVLAGDQVAVLPWYWATDVFALPSHHEGLSNSLLEAMSCGLPIVSTEVSGSVEIFGECDVGELVAVGNETALAEAITHLLKDSGRRASCGARARDYAEARFSIRRVAEETAKLYQRLMDNRMSAS